MESLERTVRRMLTEFGGHDQSAARRWQHLKNDLEVTPLEIELVALEVEQLVGVTLALDELVAVQTVGDLLAFFFHGVRRERREHTLFGATPKKVSRQLTRTAPRHARVQGRGASEINETLRRGATNG